MDYMTLVIIKKEEIFLKGRVYFVPLIFKMYVILYLLIFILDKIYHYVK